MTIQLYRLIDNDQFPHPDLALDEPNGLLAYGGDLSVERLVTAYENGIFPWFSEGEPLLWWSPNPRGVLLLDDYHCTRSLAKLIRQDKYQIHFNTQFEQVIRHCANAKRSDKGTWITEDMILAYISLHRAGFAHSVEILTSDDVLVGGLYGVGLGKVFCGESMFHTEANTSKLAFHALVRHMQKHGSRFIDCQMQTPHLATFGTGEIPRKEFLLLLDHELTRSTGSIWREFDPYPLLSDE